MRGSCLAGPYPLNKVITLQLQLQAEIELSPCLFCLRHQLDKARTSRSSLSLCPSQSDSIRTSSAVAEAPPQAGPFLEQNIGSNALLKMMYGSDS